jgi:hypothetical protein
MPSLPHPVIITWKDAHDTLTSWEDLEAPTDNSEYLVSTVGWLLPNRKKGHHVVALNLSDAHVASGVAIPNDMVVSCKPLAPSKKPWRSSHS